MAYLSSSSAQLVIGALSTLYRRLSATKQEVNAETIRGTPCELHSTFSANKSCSKLTVLVSSSGSPRRLVQEYNSVLESTKDITAF
jgi:hypothetical protein